MFYLKCLVISWIILGSSGSGSKTYNIDIDNLEPALKLNKLKLASLQSYQFITFHLTKACPERYARTFMSLSVRLYELVL